MRQALQKGYSLLEMALVIAAVGMVVTVGATIFQQRAESSRAVTHSALVASADQAITGFVYTHSRLPCPASSDNGVEDCSVTTGLFPFRTVGMSAPPLNSAGYPLHYGHFSRPDVSAASDAALASLRDRFRPYYAASAPAIAQPQIMGSRNGLDFCQALVIAETVSSSPTLLNVAEQGSGDIRHVAYVLVNPGAGDADGNGNRLDGINASFSDAQPSLESPGRSSDSNYDDRVHAVYFNQLSQTLNCANVMAPTTAHANVVSAASVMEQVIRDYQKQLELMDLLSEADLVTAAGDILSATVDGAATLAESQTSISSTINTAGSTSGAIASAAVAIALAATAMVVSVAGQVSAGVANAAIGNEVDAFQSHRVEIVVQKNAIEQNLIDIDAGGLYD